MMDKADTVKKTNVFSTLEEDELAQVLRITRERRFAQGDVIMEEGKKGDTMYIMVEGEVEVSKRLTMKFGEEDFRETDKVLTRFLPEDHVVFGEMALIGADNRSASIVAKTDCILLEVGKDDFINLVEGTPKIGVKILLKLCDLLISRVRECSQDVIRLTTALSIALSR